MQNTDTFNIEKFIAARNFNLPEGSVSDGVLRHIYEIGKSQKLVNTVETGCGRTTVILSWVSQNHTVFAKVDSSNRDTLEADWMNPSKVSWTLGPTQKTLPQFDFKTKLDFVLIDGPHGYPFPELEYYYLYPHLKQGGWLVVDDIQIATVQHLFRFLKEEPMFSYDCTVDGNTAFFRRTAAPVFDPYGDGWWEQPYNLNHMPWKIRTKDFVKRRFPWTITVNAFIKRRMSSSRPAARQ